MTINNNYINVDFNKYLFNVHVPIQDQKNGNKMIPNPFSFFQKIDNMINLKDVINGLK